MTSHSPEKIIAAMAKLHDMHPLTITGASRKKEIVAVKHLTMYMMKQYVIQHHKPMREAIISRYFEAHRLTCYAAINKWKDKLSIKEKIATKMTNEAIQYLKRIETPIFCNPCQTFNK